MEREELFTPSLHTSTIVCSAFTPWSKTGAFYYPRYPESWRGTACSLPRGGWWDRGATTRPGMYRQSYRPRYRLQRC